MENKSSEKKPGSVRTLLIVESIGLAVLAGAVIAYLVTREDSLKDIAMTALGALIILTKEVADNYTKSS